MRKSVILMILGVFNLLHAQSVEFQLQRLSACDRIPVAEDQYYYLTDITYDLTNEGYSNSDSSVIVVPKPGKYLVHRVTEPNIEPYEVDLNPGLNVEVVRDSKIIQRLSYTVEPYSYYQVCGKIAEGYHEEFYPNGKIRIRGNFKDGNIKDSIAQYYSNGKPEQRTSYSRKGVFFTSYDSLGNKKQFRWSAGRSCSVSYCSYKEIWYTPDESVAYEISSIDHVVKFRRYYSDGNIMFDQNHDSRVEYYSNGKMKNEYTWNTRKRKHRYTHYIKHKEYDVNGKLLAEKLNEETSSDFPQPEIAYQYNNPFWE